MFFVITSRNSDFKFKVFNNVSFNETQTVAKENWITALHRLWLLCHRILSLRRKTDSSPPPLRINILGKSWARYLNGNICVPACVQMERGHWRSHWSASQAHKWFRCSLCQHRRQERGTGRWARLALPIPPIFHKLWSLELCRLWVVLFSYSPAWEEKVGLLGEQKWLFAQ